MTQPLLAHLLLSPAAAPVGAFRAWYLAQLAATDAMLRRLRAGGDATSAAEQLQAVMDRLGMTAADLARLSSGELAAGHGG